jgi:tetratricopeptide (TPR) repeat protein
MIKTSENTFMVNKWIKLTVITVLCSVNMLFANGLPGEYILSDQWRIFSSFHSPLTNPALLNEQNYLNVRGAGCVAPDNGASLYEGSVTMPVGLFQTAAISALWEKGRTMENWQIDNSGRMALDSNQSSVRNDNFFFTGSYSINPWKRLSLGLNVNVASQGNFGNPTIGIGVDAGLTYRVLLHPIFGYHLAGISARNIISPSFDMSADSKDMGFPLQLGLLYHTELIGKLVTFDCQFNMADFLSQAQAFKNNEKKIEWDLKMQGSYRLFTLFNLRAFTQFSETKKLDYWGFATGVNLPQANNGRDMEFLYQFRDEISKNLKSSHTLYLKIDMGKHREEIYARKMARMANLSASDLYNRAMKLYTNEKYWDAFFIYQRILIEFPDFFRNDFVTYYAGSCLENMDMRENADKIYKVTRDTFSTSTVAPASILGRMRIAYRQAQFDTVYQLYLELNVPTVPDSLRQHGSYIVGEAAMRRSKPSVALQYFQLVQEKHPDYIFAQNSSGTAYALLDSESSLIVSALENCISSNPQTAAGKEIVNRSCVLMGYLFYEDNAMSKAVVALRMVPSTSYYYEDALLGLGWSAVKARQWNDCKNVGQLLMDVSKKRIIQCEGALLQAYSMTMEQKYTQAETVVKIALEKMRKYRNVSEDTMSMRKLKYENSRMAYSFLSDEVIGVSNKGAAASLQELDQLHNKQLKTKSEIDEFLDFEPEFRRKSFFGRSASKVLEDLEYADATIQKIMNKKSTTKLDNQEKAIDQEIEKLKKEMEKIQ